jgi:HEAT repeat protein
MGVKRTFKTIMIALLLCMGFVVMPAWAEDFPALARTGLHHEKTLAQTRMITGRSVAEITMAGRPGRSSGIGFMAADEDIISVLTGDNRLVKKLGLTHPDLAAPLSRLWQLIREREKTGSGGTGKEADHIMYNGKKVCFKSRGGRGWQDSIFNDSIRGSYRLDIWRDLEPREQQLLDSAYPRLNPKGKKELVRRLSHIHTGEMVIPYIKRYGFYEGHTGYRADPVAISFVFGLRDLKGIETAFKGDLPGVLNRHHNRDNLGYERLSDKHGQLLSMIRDMHDKDTNTVLKLAVETGQAAVPSLIDIIEDPSWHDYVRGYWVKRKAVMALEKIKSPEVIRFLIHSLGNRQLKAQLRGYMARAVGRLKPANGADVLINVLNDALMDPEVRARSALALQHYKSEKVIETLTAVLRDKQKGVRQGAVIALGIIGGEKAVPALVMALKDPDSLIRWYALRYLGREKPAMTDLFVNALRDHDWMVREAAKKLLVKRGEDILERLVPELKTGGHRLRWEVVNVLGRIKSENSVDVLVETLKDKEWMVSNEAVAALVRINSKRAVKPLKKLLDHPEPRVRQDAAWILKKLKNR